MVGLKQALHTLRGRTTVHREPALSPFSAGRRAYETHAGDAPRRDELLREAEAQRALAELFPHLKRDALRAIQDLFPLQAQAREQQAQLMH